MASRAEPYGRQVAPTRNTSGLPQVSADAFGAGVGEAMQGVAVQQMQEDVTVRRLEAQKAYDIENIETMARWAKYQEEYGLWRNEARANAPLGAMGHTEAARKKLMEEDREAFLSQIKNDAIRKNYEAKWADWSGNRLVEEDLFERGKSAEYAGMQYGVAIEMMANAARTATTEQFAEMRDEFLTAERPENVDEATWAKWQRGGMQSVTYSWIEGRSPEEVKKLIGSGAFNDILTTEQIDRLEGNADIEIKRMQYEAEAKAREEKAEVKQKVDNIMRRLGDGFPITPEEDEYLRTNIPKYGLDKDGYDYAVITVQRGVATKYTNATPAQMQTSLNELEALGDKATPEQIIERNYLRTELPRRQSSFSADPLSAGASMGVSIGPVDWGNRNSVRDREEAAEAVSKKTGLPAAYLTDEEVKAFAPQMATINGKTAVADHLRGFSTPRKRYLAAKQIAPNDPVFAASMALPRTTQQRVFDGSAPEAVKLHPVPGDKAQAVWARTGGIALSEMSASKKGEVFQMAVAIYRSHAIERGETKFNEDLFEGSIEAALGSYTGQGGINGGLGTWHGNYFMVPDGMTETRFGALAGYYRFDKNPSYYPVTATSGKRMNWDYLFLNYYPVHLANGNFGWKRKGSQEFVKDNDGGVYEMDILAMDKVMRKDGL